MAPFLLRPTHINYFSFYDLNYESLLDVVSKTNSTHLIGHSPKDILNPHSPRVVNNRTVHPHPTRRDVTVHMNAMMSIHISNSNGSHTIIFHIIQTFMLTHQLAYINILFLIHISSHSIQSITCKQNTWTTFSPNINPDF